MKLHMLSRLGVMMWSAVCLLLFTVPCEADRLMAQLIGQARDRDFLLRLIDAERPPFSPPAGVTGIGVPHHMLAADLIARGFWAASGQRYKRVIVLAPDHFRLVEGRFATSLRPFETVFGRVEADAEAVELLLADRALFEPGNFDREHALQVEMPYIRYFFPDARVVPVLASIFTTPEDWKAATALLSRIADKDTLIVQSIDYSHYRAQGDAIARDQESIAMIVAGDPEGVAPMTQPAHMDSKAAQYIQMALQQRVYDARPTILANRNSTEYGGLPDNTTSYIVSVFHPDPAAFSVARYPDQSVVYFAGDTLPGRFFQPSLVDGKVVAAIVDAVTRRTAGGPLIVNLEGVLVGEPVANPPAGSHLMHADIAGPVLQALNVRAAGLANNHSRDFGSQGLQETVGALGELGIRPMIDGEVSDFGTFRLMPLMLPTSVPGGGDYVKMRLETACRAAAQPPFVVFAHWGTEYTAHAGPKEQEAARYLADCGTAAIIGAHSHRASPTIDAVAGRLQSVYSLGNFIFDQKGTRSSGVLAELRVFHQGTAALRLIPLPNLFDLATAVRQAGD